MTCLPACLQLPQGEAIPLLQVLGSYGPKVRDMPRITDHLDLIGSSTFTMNSGCRHYAIDLSRIFGYEPGTIPRSVSAETMLLYTHASDRAELAEIMRNNPIGSDPIITSLRVVHAAGTVFWVSTVMIPLGRGVWNGISWFTRQPFLCHTPCRDAQEHTPVMMSIHRSSGVRDRAIEVSSLLSDYFDPTDDHTTVNATLLVALASLKSTHSLRDVIAVVREVWKSVQRDH